MGKVINIGNINIGNVYLNKGTLFKEDRAMINTPFMKRGAPVKGWKTFYLN